VKKLFGKYVIFAMSLLLILSNFSYATQFMFCEMGGDSEGCECSHNNSRHYYGLSITSEKTKCCLEETSELSNTNTLNTLKTELPKNINAFSALILDLGQKSNLLISPLANLIIDKSHLPKLDIPILTSSLLI
jgi:hypothetical protein